MNNQTKTAQLPATRCTTDMRNALEAIAANSITGNLGDHIRLAVQEYIDKNKTATPKATVARHA